MDGGSRYCLGQIIAGQDIESGGCRQHVGILHSLLAVAFSELKFRKPVV